MRPGDRGRAGADMEVGHFLEGRKVEAVVVLERRDRALHHAAELVLHALVCPKWRAMEPQSSHEHNGREAGCGRLQKDATLSLKSDYALSEAGPTGLIPR